MPRTKAPLLLPRPLVEMKRAPTPARVNHAAAVANALVQALFTEETAARGLLAIEAAQRAWLSDSLSEYVDGVVGVLAGGLDVEAARGWLVAVDARFADLTDVELNEALLGWREAVRNRRPGPRSGPTCGRIVWQLMRSVGATTATEATIDREVRRALRRGKAG